MAITDAANVEAAQILTDAREEGTELASVDAVAKEYAAANELMMKIIKDKLGEDGYEQIAGSFRKEWKDHPDNQERDVSFTASPSMGF